MSFIDITFSSDLKLTYELKHTPVVETWVRLLNEMPKQLHSRSSGYNHLHGFATQEEIQVVIDRLYEIAKKHNLTLPPITKDNWHQVLNEAHVYFPNWDMRYEDSMNDAHEFNVAIHWLEYELANIYEQHDEYLVNVDFNQDRNTRAKLFAFEPNDYSHFSPTLEFGNIHLHYVHKGRHFMEMANAWDMSAPSNHFVPQHRYSATFGMVFNEGCTRDYTVMPKYYNLRGGVDFFHKSWDDPTLGAGFYKLGQLIDVEVYRRDAQLRSKVRDQLRGSHVVDWVTYE